MRLIFVRLRPFQADAEHLRLTDEDLRALEIELLERPDAGKLIPGTGGLRKVRFAPPSFRRGKSGACRVCYAWFPEVHAVYLCVIYTKQERDDMAAADKQYFKQTLEAYRAWLKDYYRGVLP